MTTTSAPEASRTTLLAGLRSHGLWAPGEYVFQRLGLKGSLAVLFLAMGLPVVLALLGLADPVLGLALGALVAAYLLVCFYRVTAAAIQDVSAHLKAMTDGDLTTSPVAQGKSEVTSLIRDLAVMQDSLKKIVTQVREASENLNTASEGIASSSLDLSQRTEEAAAQLQQSSQAMAEIASTVKDATHSTVQAAELASRNAAVADKGSSTIGEAVATMEQVKASSNKISDIISVIDGIAFQTNILALNAAVEAARAGEQGRGFAVVASEVRSLAGRSSSAAREIRDLITNSVKQVQSGTQVVQGTGQVMREIVESAQTMRALLNEVSTSSAANSDSLGQMGQSIHALDALTKENAARVKDTASAAAGMKSRCADIAAAAKELGMQARHLPIEPGKATPKDGDAFGALMKELPKPILAYCRTGMRSTALWKLSHPGQNPLAA